MLKKTSNIKYIIYTVTIVTCFFVSSFKQSSNSINHNLTNNDTTFVSDSLDSVLNLQRNYDDLKWSIRVKLFFKELFASKVELDNTKNLIIDSTIVTNLSDQINKISEIQNKYGLEDTLSLYYKKFKKIDRKPKRKGKRKKLWVEGDFSKFYKNYLEQKIKDSLYSFKPIYHSHQVDLDYYLVNFLDTFLYKSEVDWSSIQNIEPEPFFKKNIKEKSVKYVYGFHPFWMGNSYYNYDFHLFNRIGYFGYVIDPISGLDLSTGIDLNAHSWSNTTLHQKAEMYDCKVDLCVASYLVENNLKIFNNSLEAKNLRKTLVNQICDLLRERGNGICFDIQKVPVQFKMNYINLIKEVDSRLNGDYEITEENEGKLYEITIILPQFDVGFPHEITNDDFEYLDSIVNRWIMTGENYYGIDNSIEEFSKSSLDKYWNYEAIDAQINKFSPAVFDKLSLEIPLYQSRNTLIGNDTIRDIVQYRHLKYLYPENYSLIDSSFREKLLYSDMKNINSIAIWGMGYDFGTNIRNILNDYTKGLDLNVNPQIAEMLSLIVENKDLTYVDENPKDLSRIEILEMPSSNLLDFKKKIKENKSMIFHAIVLCLMILLFFVFCGFIIALFYEIPREFILSKERFINGFVLSVSVGVCLLFKRLNIIDDILFSMLVGIIFGIVVSLFFLRKRKKKELEETP